MDFSWIKIPSLYYFDFHGVRFRLDFVGIKSPSLYSFVFHGIGCHLDFAKIQNSQCHSVVAGTLVWFRFFWIFLCLNFSVSFSKLEMMVLGFCDKKGETGTFCGSLDCGLERNFSMGCVRFSF